MSEPASADLPGTQQAPPLTPRDFREPWKQPFLELYCRIHNISACARIIGIHRDTVKWARDHDPVFAEAFREAEEIAVDLIRQLGHRAATVGQVRRRVTRRVIRDAKGNVVGDVETTTEETIADNQMLRTYLQAYAPEFRGTDTVVQTGPVQMVVYRPRSPERALEIARLVVEDAERRLAAGAALPDIEARALPVGEDDEMDEDG